MILEDAFKDIINRFNLDNNLKEPLNIKWEIKDIGLDNGQTIPPEDISKPIRIIINPKILCDILNNNYQIYCTVYHELIHALDYYTFCKNNYDGDYLKMKSDKLYPSFLIWTEYNAKRKSYIYYRGLLQNDVKCKKAYDLLINQELPFCNKNIDESIDSCLTNHNILYDITHYLARYMVWEDTFPIEINNYKYMSNKVKEILGKSLDSFYNFFKINMNTTINITSLIKLREIIEECNTNITIYILNNFND